MSRIHGIHHSVRGQGDVNVKAQAIRVLNTYRFAHFSKIGACYATTETEGAAAKESDSLQGPVHPFANTLAPTLLRLLRLNEQNFPKT